MIPKFVQAWDARKGEVEAQFKAEHPKDYKAIVTAVVSILGNDTFDEYPDPSRVHQIDDGDYQGTLLFVIAAAGYQPSDYWYVRVSYGSCSGCDTLEAIQGYSDDPPTEQQVRDYMTLALHVLQGLVQMGGETV